MTLAERLGHAGPLAELMRSMTNREYEVWMEWLSQGQDRPDRGDWYLMQIAAEIRKLRLKTPTPEGYNPNAVQLKDLKLTREPKEPPRPKTREEAAEQSKARWFGWLKIKR